MSTDSSFVIRLLGYYKQGELYFFVIPIKISIVIDSIERIIRLY